LAISNMFISIKWGNVEIERSWREEVGRNQHEARRDGAVCGGQRKEEVNRRILPFTSPLGSERNILDRLVKSEPLQPAGPVMMNRKMDLEIMSV
jgi:hypothetical protein